MIRNIDRHLIKYLTIFFNQDLTHFLSSFLFLYFSTSSSKKKMAAIILQWEASKLSSPYL